MKFRIVLMGILMAFASIAGAQESKLNIQSGSKLWIEGTSNLHGWSATTTTIEAVVKGNLSAPTSVDVTVPVKSLHSAEGGKMDNNIYGALKADKFSTITFNASKYDATSGQLTGTLTIAGQTKDVVVQTNAKTNADGSVSVTGQVQILMTDFGVSPPTAFFGALRTGNAVTVKFEITAHS